MKKLAALTLICCLKFAPTFSQHAAVNGVINDTINKQPLSNAVVMLLRAKDSVMHSFTRSDAKGFFTLNKLPADNYILLVTYPGFADYADKIKLTDTSQVQAGSVSMTLMATLLKEVVVQQQIAAIRMRGDTLEFKADSFKVREGASVEEMLKKLPGIQVDKDGKITAQGEKVEKVLVDGEEFFGDDPTVATKNLQADAIDKVQVFDKKSDQAAFTGIDDGESKKTINLKMKDEKKKGYFGKLDVGSSANDRWNASAMFNRFRAKQKLSAYGIISSTGVTGLNWDERDKYGGGTNLEYSDDFDGFYFNSGGDEFNNSSYYGEGLPKSWNGGLQYSNKFNDDKQNINGSYRYNKIKTEGSGSTFSQSILPDTLFFNKEASTSYNTRERHSANGIYEWQIDSTTSLKVTASGYKGKQQNFTDYTSEALNEDSLLVNRSRRKTLYNTNNENLTTNALLRKRFKKAGRTVALSFDQQYTNTQSEGFLNAVISKYDAGVLTGENLTDQRKDNNNKIDMYNTKITYTEPLSKKLFAEINYALRISNSNAQRFSYDKQPNGKYDDLNDTFSNSYRFNVLTNTAGLAFKLNEKKITLGFGSDVARSTFKQTDLLNDSITKRNYTNLFPKANFVYKFNANSRININYRGNTTQPTIQQIQPVKDNSNPLVQVVGNPLLKQEFNNNISMNFNSYKVLSQRGIYLYGSYNFTNNAIVTSNTTTSNALTTLQYINVDGNYNYYSGGGYNMKIMKLDLGVRIGPELSGSRYNNIVNNVKNETVNNAQGINFGMYKDKEKKYNFYYNASISYNKSSSSIRPDVKTHYWTQWHNLSANIQLPFKFELNNEVEGNFRQKTALFDKNNNVIRWNAYLGKKLLKNDKGLIKISAYDILNQNKGYDRNISSNVISERYYQTLQRYFMLSFVWNFSKNPAGINQ